METIQLSEFEIKQIEEIKKNYEEISSFLGQIELQISMLTSKKESVINQINEIQSKEIEFSNLLKYKYGDGSVDLVNGIFIPKNS